MNLERRMPSVMWTRGRKIVSAGQVEIVQVDENAGSVQATVYGTKAYSVTVAANEADDWCDCPYFFSHAYCKHIAAVILTMKQADAPTSITMRTHQPAPASSGAQLVAHLALPPVQYFHGLNAAGSGPLKLEVTLFISQYRREAYLDEPRFFVTLRVGEAGGRWYVVGDMQGFLRAYNEETTYQTGGKAQLTLSHAAFAAPEQAVLDALSVTAPVETDHLYYSTNAPRKLAMLNVGQVTALTPVFNQLAAFRFEPFDDGEVYRSFSVAPYEVSQSPLKLKVGRDRTGFAVSVNQPFSILIPAERLIMAANQAFQLTPAQTGTLNQLLNQLSWAIDQHRGKGPLLHFRPDEMAALQEFMHFFRQVGQVQADTIEVPHMVAHFDLRRHDQQLDLTLQYAYGDHLIAENTPAGGIERNPIQETQARDYLRSLGFWLANGAWHQSFSDGETLYHFFTAELPNLKQNGVVTIDPALAALQQNGAELNPQVAVSEADGLLTVAFSFDGIAPAAIDQVLAQLDGTKPYVQRGDGGIVIVDEQLRHLSKALSQLRHGTLKDGQMQVSAAQALVVQASLGDQATFDAQFNQIATDLRQPAQYPVNVPASVNAHLRPYQVAGVQWLEMLDAHGFGGILADEMGLGKTLQLLTFLAARHQPGQPDLVVAPASLLYNWRAECEKFTPGLHAVVVDGSKAEREATIAAGADLLITSYSSALRDAEAYAAVDLGYLVLDEAQYVKNSSAKTNQALRQLQPKNTFALSGTPIENRPEELWAIFALVMPGLLPSKRAFNQLTPAEIALRVSPFILRREKAKVLKDLPAKSEFNLHNEMTKAQKTVYLAQLQQMQVKVKGLSPSGLVKNKLAILAGLTRLRQICDTPALYLDDYRGGSGKLDQLDDLIQEALDGGKQVLVFSQFTQMLAQIQQRLDAQHQDYFRLAGDTKPKDRLEMVDAFNAGEKSLFLISLKAGGTGLNLTGASVVILVDLWWNPAVEDQATGRAHRIGQKHAVDVYRLITKGTIEEQIVKLQAKKRDLVDQVLGGVEQKAGLSTEEIKLILGIAD
ncbi:SNF2-related protein [Lacticaseibacillus salsurivasis]|uniref:DEAD/DEAH box helicase n=1 Tax=Lacticaseibacillus salsurivasis TaxID=3081441 RepID=UPI0030C66800